MPGFFLCGEIGPTCGPTCGSWARVHVGGIPAPFQAGEFNGAKLRKTSRTRAAVRISEGAREVARGTVSSRDSQRL